VEHVLEDTGAFLLNAVQGATRPLSAAGGTLGEAVAQAQYGEKVDLVKDFQQQWNSASGLVSDISPSTAKWAQQTAASAVEYFQKSQPSNPAVAFAEGFGEAALKASLESATAKNPIKYVEGTAETAGLIAGAVLAPEAVGEFAALGATAGAGATAVGSLMTSGKIAQAPQVKVGNQVYYFGSQNQAAEFAKAIGSVDISGEAAKYGGMTKAPEGAQQYWKVSVGDQTYYFTEQQSAQGFTSALQQLPGQLAQKYGGSTKAPSASSVLAKEAGEGAFMGASTAAYFEALAPVMNPVLSKAPLATSRLGSALEGTGLGAGGGALLNTVASVVQGKAPTPADVVEGAVGGAIFSGLGSAIGSLRGTNEQYTLTKLKDVNIEARPSGVNAVLGDNAQLDKGPPGSSVKRDITLKPTYISVKPSDITLEPSVKPSEKGPPGSSVKRDITLKPTYIRFQSYISPISTRAIQHSDGIDRDVSILH
jgi:YHS domain-containing protein